MKTLIRISLALVLALSLMAFFSNTGISQITKDLSQKNINFNNPFVTYGTELDIPLIVLNESFEGATFPPSGWMKINPDGGTGWNRQAAGTTPIPGWTGGIITAPPLGGTKVAFSTWTTGGAFSNDQWLVTPQIVNSKTDDSLSFWVRFWPSNVYADTVYVKISTTSPTISGFTTDVATIPFPRNSPDTNWTKYTYHIGNLMPVASSYYIAFIEKVDDNFNDGASVSLDLVSVVSTECDPDVPFLTTLDYPGAGPHQEGKVTYQYPWKPDGFIDIHCGLNPNMSVDPCNPWTLVFYAALWEQKTGNDLVKFLPPRFNWNQDSCQWITFDVVYPLNYIPDTYVDSIVMKITMKPKPVTNCTIIQNPVRCDMPPYQYYDPDCWRDCINELLTLEGQDNCSPPNSAICRIEWDKPLPVELTSFTSTVNNNTVTLNWNTGSEKNNARFIVQRMKEGTWNEIGTVAGNGTTNNANSYSFTDKNLYSGIYNYRLKQVDYNGSFEYLNLNGVITIGQPEKFSLSQNYPNPFNPTTTIHFGVPNDGLVTMKIYNLNGREVKTIVNDFRTAGYYTVSFNASDLASGIYYYKLTAGNNSAVNKMVVIK